MVREIEVFLLNLKYLTGEAAVFAQFGQNLSSQGVNVRGRGTLGVTKGGAKITFLDPTVTTLASLIWTVQKAHIGFLQGLLGSDSIAEPSIDLTKLRGGFASGDTGYLQMMRSLLEPLATYYASSIGGDADPATVTEFGRMAAADTQLAAAIRLQMIRLGVTDTALDSKDQPPTSQNLVFITQSASAATTPSPTDPIAGLPPVRSNADLLAIFGSAFPSGQNSP